MLSKNSIGNLFLYKMSYKGTDITTYPKANAKGVSGGKHYWKQLGDIKMIAIKIPWFIFDMYLFSDKKI